MDKAIIKKGTPLRSADIITLDGTNTTLTALVDHKKTLLFFLRDSACILTMYEIKLLKKQYDLIMERDVQPIVCVQADHEASRKNLPDSYPFPILCDAEHVLYQLYGVMSAPDKNAMEGEYTRSRLTMAKEGGFIHGKDSGDPLQLPAVFYIDESGIIQYAFYGRTAEDVPSVKELLSVLS